jgi:hypothetical protein
MVEATWGNTNKALYISKGYVFTKMGDKLYVHAKDLPLKSHVKIKYTCDICGKQLRGEYSWFTKRSNCLCLQCASKIKAEKQKKPFSDVKKVFEVMGYELKSTKSDYDDNKSKLVCTCKKHGDFTTTYRNVNSGCGCPKCGVLKRTGSNNVNWKGGITEIYGYLRKQLYPWVFQQLQRVNFKCELTGKSGVLNVHHIYSFSNIVRDTMEELQLDIRPNVGDYSEDELQLIVVNFLKNNELKAKPIVMLEDVHIDFHRFCGGNREETTIKQLEEFKKQLNNGVAC